MPEKSARYMLLTPSRRLVMSSTSCSFSAVGIECSSPSGLDRAENDLEIDGDPRTHGRAQRDGLEIGALRRRRLRAHELAQERERVLIELLLQERRLADQNVHVDTLVDPVLDLAGFELLDRLGHVERHRPALWVGHESAQAQD